MKNSVLLTLLCFFQILVSAQQTAHQVTFRVEDQDTHKTIPGAMVSIKQISGETKSTDATGKVIFYNIPIGQIDYTVQKDGYAYWESEVNVVPSTVGKDNSFYVSLFKRAPDALLINGKVTDADGKNVGNAWVEAVIGNVERTVETGTSGFFSLDIKPTPGYPANVVRIEVRKGDECKTSDIIELNGGKSFYKLYQLGCIGERGTTPGGGGVPLPKNEPLRTETVNNFKISIDRFEQHNSKATFFYTLENLSAANSIFETGLYGTWQELIDQEGNTFNSISASIGNEESNQWVGVKLIYNNPVKGYVQFDVGEVRVSKAALLKLSFQHVEEIEIVNLKLK